MKLMPRSRASFTIRVVSCWPRLPMFILPPNCMLPSATSLTMRPVCPSVLCFISCAPCAARDRGPQHRRLPCSLAADCRHDHRKVEVGGAAVLRGFVHPGAFRLSLFETAVRGSRGFHDEPQVFRCKPQFEGLMKHLPCWRPASLPPHLDV